MLKHISLSIAVALLCGCATKPTVATPKPVVRTIAVVAATPPRTYTFENLSALQFISPIAGSAYAISNSQKSLIFNQWMATKGAPMADTLTRTVMSELTAYGYTVELLEHVERPRDYPDNIDYEKLRFKQDAVLQLLFSEAGLISSRSSDRYLPRLNARATLLPKGSEDYFFDEVMYYGLDAREGKTWSIVSDPSDSYAGFDEIEANRDKVASRFDLAAGLIAKKLARQIHDALGGAASAMPAPPQAALP